ncbi:cytochrome P450 71D8-like [Senna tora]|uniref:Cytochrome P450 71D8-like n=1 Tax=Senna tora TaxID=362788 RepID=A0A834XAJ9_9FABA|nr:cytochrome P450 71D8-like [Senna tora]
MEASCVGKLSSISSSSEVSTVIVSSPEMAKEVLKTHDLSFAQRPILLTSVYGSDNFAFAPYGDYWRQMRKICTLHLLSANKVQSFSFVRQHEVDKFIESIQLSVGSEMDLTSKIYSLSSAIVTRTAFGRKSRDQNEELVQLLNIAFAQSSGFSFFDLFPSLKPLHLIIGQKKLKDMYKKVDQILEDIIKENQERQMRIEAGEEDGYFREENLVQVLLQIKQSGLEIPITTRKIKAVIWDIFLAGTDTSATTIEWAMSELMKNPKVMEKAQIEIRQAFKEEKEILDGDHMDKLSYLKCIIKETLRLHPPAPLLLPRECREACKINGYEIPIKTKVIVNAWAIGRDPKYWYEAERFIPERFQGSCVNFVGGNFEYIPFGGGRRICPGISLGIASIELPLARLLYHFDWKLPSGMKAEDLDMTEAFGVTVGRKEKLYLIPTPYYHNSF